MSSTWTRRAGLFLAFVAAVATVAGPTAGLGHGGNACAPADADCIVTTERSEPCGFNRTVGGETCVERYRVDARLPAPVPVSAYVEDERAVGHVDLEGTPNAWTTERAAVGVQVMSARVDVDANRLVSSQERGDGSTGQAYQDVRVTAAGAPLAAGASVRFLDGLPYQCAAVTPFGTITRECSPAPALALLP